MVTKPGLEQSHLVPLIMIGLLYKPDTWVWDVIKVEPINEDQSTLLLKTLSWDEDPLRVHKDHRA